ncbi:MAG TPA: ABC transporter ATP-binding protein, partial [Acidimicrobiales bacterium]|nr:ABC transporter ATP-binding protein [Acidimicrobiales bacterium]
MRRLGRHMLVHRTDMIVALGGAVLGAGCQTLVPLVERQIVDKVVVTHTSSLWPWLTALIVLAGATFAFAYLRRYHGGRLALSVQYDLRNAMHDHLQTMDAEHLDRMPTGQLVGRANSDSTLVQGLLNFFPIMSSNILLLVLSIVVMLCLSPLLAVISLVIAPVLLLISYRMRWKVFPATWDAQQREGDVVQIVDEDLNGVRVVKAFGQEDKELDRIVDATKVLYSSQMRAVRLQARYQPVLQAVPALGQVAVLAFGGWMALKHQISLGTFLAFSAYITQLVAPAQRLAGLLTIAQQARAGVERIFQLLDTTPAIADATDAMPLPPGRGAVDLTGVDFSYADGTQVLHGFELHVAPGERVAMVGPSGSGKSTAALLIPRFYDPQIGTVTIDGHDVRGLTLHSLRRRVGVVFEESFLFSDSVRSNIAYGRPDADNEAIEAAAKAAGADEFIRALPRGYDTTVGERGLTLSGGQRQRIALARALLYDPEILILDDATSAVDARTEEAIHDALREVMADRTTLLIAHRRSTLRLADRIVVVDDGRVVDDGTHEELLERSSLYRTLLTGLEEDESEDGAGPIGDNIEALAVAASRGNGSRGNGGPNGASGNGVTASAWQGSRSGGRSSSAATRAGRVSAGTPSIGPGLGGGGGGWRANLAPTPE